MDSVTQVVLGAAVGEAVLGRKVGNKALLWGAIAGTIPDLDVISRYVTDSLTANEMHRGFSHSIVFCLLLSPIMGYLLNKLYQKKNEASIRDWTMLMFWGLFTHPLLDAFTTWGTQLFWPLEYKVSFKNIFVVDPLYTLPFLTCTTIVLFLSRDSLRRRKVNWLGIKMSSFYMVITLFLKWASFGKFEDSLKNQKIDYLELQTKPTPFNAVLWTANVMQKDSFKIGFYSFFDKRKEIDFKSFPKNLHLIKGFEESDIIQRLIKLTEGWYTISKQDDKLYFNDLRFGPLGASSKATRFVFRYHLVFDKNGALIGANVEDPKSNNMKELFTDLVDRVKGI